MPERFKLTCTNEKGGGEQVVMIHAAISGSLERFTSILIEHLSGNFPVWLSPIQVWVIPVGADHHKYAKEITAQLKENDIRVETKTENDTVGKKIRESEMQKIPYVLVVGDKEIQSKLMAVRSRGKDLESMKLDKFIDKIKIEISNKK